MRSRSPLSPPSLPQGRGAWLLAALALLTAAGCNNFKKGTPSDAGGGDGAGADARRDGGGQGGAAGHHDGGGEGGAAGHHDGGGEGGAAGNHDGGAVDHPAGVDAHRDAGTDASQLPTSGLVAYYPFNNNTLDESGNGYNAMANLGAFDADRFNRANSAYNLVPNDANDWYGIVSAPELPLPSNSLTIAFWTKVSPQGNNERIIGVGSMPQNAPQFQFSGQQVTFGWHGANAANSAVVTDPTAIMKGTWTFFAGEFYQDSSGQGDRVTLYRNGVSVASQLFVDFFTAGSPVACRFYMGNTLLGDACNSTSQANEYPGDLDDVRVYNRPLSDAEVLALYNETL